VTVPPMPIETCYLPSGANCQQLIPNFMAQSFSAMLTGLTNSTTYYFRLVGMDSNNGSYQYGAILSFTTLNGGAPPKFLLRGWNSSR